MITETEKKSLADRLRAVADDLDNAKDGMIEIADSLDPPEELSPAMRYMVDNDGCVSGACQNAD